jgi:hypothetical protein
MVLPSNDQFRSAVAEKRAISPVSACLPELTYSPLLSSYISTLCREAGVLLQGQEGANERLYKAIYRCISGQVRSTSVLGGGGGLSPTILPCVYLLFATESARA